MTGKSSFRSTTILPDYYKEYITVAKCKTSDLLQIKYWTVWYMDHFSASSCTRVTNCRNGRFCGL